MEQAQRGNPRRAVAPREVPVGRRWVPRDAGSPSRALTSPPPPSVASDVIVWSRLRDAVPLLALFLVSFTVVRIAAGRGSDVVFWVPVTAVVSALALALFLVRRHRIEADADGVRRRGPLGWRLEWADIAEVRLDGTRDQAAGRGWFHLGAPGSSVHLEIVPDDAAARRAHAHGAVASELASGLGELARYHGVPTKEASPVTPRRAAS